MVNLVSQLMREQNGKFNDVGLKAHYSSIFVKNIYFVSQTGIHLFILYQIVYFSRTSSQYKAFNTYDTILGREVPAVVAFNNFNLLKDYFSSRNSGDQVKYAEAHV